MAVLGTNTTINYDIDGEFQYLEDVNLVTLIEFSVRNCPVRPGLVRTGMDGKNPSV
jgi:hypothetical protein